MTTPALADALSEITVICQGAFAEPVAVSITLGDPSSPTVVATASKLAQSLDGAQMVAGTGPAHLCWAERRTVDTADLRADPRWSRLASRLAGSAVCTAVSAPIEAQGAMLGVLNVYSVSPTLLDAATVETVELLADSVASIVHQARAKERLETVADQLQTALRSRATIDQAKGVLMARHGCTAEEAFRLLVDASSSANLKLREVAIRLVEEAAQGRGQDPDTASGW